MGVTLLIVIPLSFFHIKKDNSLPGLSVSASCPHRVQALLTGHGVPRGHLHEAALENVTTR